VDGRRPTSAEKSLLSQLMTRVSKSCPAIAPLVGSTLAYRCLDPQQVTVTEYPLDITRSLDIT
jgi:hypothetical protein